MLGRPARGFAYFCRFRPSFAAVSADRDAEGAKERERELFEEIGRLKMELEWLKKKAGELER